MRNNSWTAAFGLILSIAIMGIAVHSWLVRKTVVPTSPHALVSGQQKPLCGQPNDEKVHLPPNWTSFVAPGLGQSYVDPVFGCPVRQLTDGNKEEVLSDGAHLSFLHYYSTLSPINATDTRILIYSNNGAWRIKDLDGKVVVPAHKMPAMNNGHPVWDAWDGNDFYYALGNSLHKATIIGNSTKNVALHAFKEYSGISMPDAADLSQDGDHVALVGKNRDSTMDVFVWSLSKQAKSSTYTTSCKIEGEVSETPQPGCVHKLLLTADNQLSIQFAIDGSAQEQGVRLWNGSALVHLQDATNHYDTGFDLEDEPVFIESGNSHYTRGITNPCPGGWGLDVRRLGELSSADCLLDKQPAWHVSFRGGPSQPWAALSFFDDRKPGPELSNSNKSFEPPSQANWLLYEDEIALARVDGGAIYRLAHARARSAEGYWSTPRAAISRDGKYITFDSNMAFPNGCPERAHAKTECMDVYLIKAF